MVANGYDGLNGGVGRDVDAEVSSDLNGVDVYRSFCCNAGWQVAEASWSHWKGLR